MKIINIKIMKSTVLLILIALLASCMDSEENKLDNRVLSYWKYKINSDFEAVYDYLSPGWKKNESREDYVQRMSNSRIEWKEVKLMDKNCSEEYLCKVTVEIKYEYMFKESMGKKVLMPSTVKQNWLMQDNVWYYVPIKTKLKSKNS